MTAGEPLPRRGDLILVTEDPDPIQVLDDFEEVPAAQLAPGLLPTYWSVHVRHLGGYWAGQTNYLLLAADDFAVCAREGDDGVPHLPPVIDGSVVAAAARRPFWPIAVTLLLQLLAALAFLAWAVTR
jgi:hypothetical protein